MAGSGPRDYSLMERAKHTISLLLGLLGLVVESPEYPGCHSQKTQFPEAREELKAQGLCR